MICTKLCKILNNRFPSKSSVCASLRRDGTTWREGGRHESFKARVPANNRILHKSVLIDMLPVADVDYEKICQ